VIYIEEAERQTLRLSVVPGIEQVALESDKIADALKRGSRNLEHAGRIVTEALNRFINAGIAPTPAEILDLADRTDLEFDPREWRCADCGGTGWKPVFQLHTWCGLSKTSVQQITRQQYDKLQTKVSGILGEQILATAAEDCHCAVGRRRLEARAADAREQAEKAGKKATREKQQRTM
jgi:hypothetical protein